MRCQRCGGLITNSFTRINGTLLCENCARELKVDDMFKRQATFFEQAFPMLGELTNGIMGTPSDLDFGNSKIKCPRCGTSLRELDSKGMLGCIECYNTYNETILKNILKKQGSSDYIGRKPGEIANIEVSEIPEEASPAPSVKVEVTPVNDSKPESNSSISVLDKIKDADWSTIPDNEIEAGMKAAAQAEDYQLAAKLRDELKSRKEGN
ncbi:MAG: UvrB/UvrC motif-containing protein [Saccharofermentans sp.]|nr:UvrB/UvrC motif-containing protein [Saccharofermentans sp.]